jgi:hypothetical protein
VAFINLMPKTFADLDSDGVYKVTHTTHSGNYEGDQWETTVEAEITTYTTAK